VSQRTVAITAKALKGRGHIDLSQILGTDFISAVGRVNPMVEGRAYAG
jgi:hypothetical protein